MRCGVTRCGAVQYSTVRFAARSKTGYAAAARAARCSREQDQQVPIKRADRTITLTVDDSMRVYPSRLVSSRLISSHMTGFALLRDRLTQTTLTPSANPLHHRPPIDSMPRVCTATQYGTAPSVPGAATHLMHRNGSSSGHGTRRCAAVGGGAAGGFCGREGEGRT